MRIPRKLERLWPGYEGSFISTTRYEDALERLAREAARTPARGWLPDAFRFGLKLRSSTRDGTFSGLYSSFVLSMSVRFHGSVTAIDVGTRVSLQVKPDAIATAFFGLMISILLILAVGMAARSWVAALVCLSMAFAVLTMAHLITFIVGLSCRGSLDAVVGGGTERRYLA